MFSKKPKSSNKILDAAKEGREEDIRKLLRKLSRDEAKILVNKANENGETALHAAAKAGNLEIVNLLLEYDANPDAIGLFNETPLHRAAAQNHAEIVKSLLASNAKYNLIRNDSQAPIHVAASNDAADVVKILIEHDSSQVSSISKEGRTPLFHAVMNGNSKTVAVILPYVKDINQPNFFNQKTALQISEEIHDEETEKLLKNAGAVEQANNRK